MRPLGDALWARRYTVMGINLPGHATTEADMAAVGRCEWLQAAFDAVSHLRLHCKTVAVCGLSMGAILSMIVAEQHQANACISISAPLPASNPLLPYSGMLGLIKPRVSWKENAERESQLDQRYDLGYSGFPTNKGYDLYLLTKQAQRDLHKIICPTLVVQSLDDHTVSKDSYQTIISHIGSLQKETLILKDVPHVCTISKKLPDIVEQIDALLQTVKTP